MANNRVLPERPKPKSDVLLEKIWPHKAAPFNLTNENRFFAEKNLIRLRGMFKEMRGVADEKLKRFSQETH